MEIRQATAADLPQIMDIFEQARRFMRQTGNPTQWGPDYPGLALMEEQIRQGVCYVCTEQGRVEGTFCLIFGADPTYAHISDGAWPDEAPYATIHRLASAGRVHGIAGTCIDWCGARAGTLRADTHADNRQALCAAASSAWQTAARAWLTGGDKLQIESKRPHPGPCISRPGWGFFI